MNTRTVCYRCRQKIIVNANVAPATIQCPSCKFEQKVSASGGLATQGGIAKSKNDSPKPVSLKYEPLSLGVDVPTRPMKRAVLIGVTYKGWKYKLDGTINDVMSMRDCLIDKFGFLAQNIRVLTEEEPEPEHHPTKRNIQNSLKWLVNGCKEGDSLVFFFSGHGLRQPDFTGQEIDGYDETICPVDFQQEGMIVDNELYATIVAPLPKGVLLHSFVDACHSGTILDLSYVYNIETMRWDYHGRGPGQSKKDTNGGLAISISACHDDQIAADTSAFNQRTMNGAMTYILTDMLKKHRVITYGKLLHLMQESLEMFDQKGCLVRRCLRRIFNERLSQKPLLSSSEPFEVYSKQFIL